MTMESMHVGADHEQVIVKRIPGRWRELFQSLRHPSDGLTRAQVWYDDVFTSQYGQAPPWSDVLEGLTAAEPVLTENGNLKFECRFTVLPVGTQKNFLTFLHQYVDTVPASHLKIFLEKISVVDTSDQWLKHLRWSLMKTLQSRQEDGGFDGDSLNRSEPFRYSFSNEENRNAFKSLCKDIQDSSYSLPWQQNYNFLESRHGDGKEDVTSPVMVTSPARVTSPDIEDEDDMTESQQEMPKELHVANIDRPEAPAVKRLKLEASQHFPGSPLNISGDFSLSQVSSPLSADDWAMVGRLKDMWGSVTGEVAVPEEIKLFLSCTMPQMKEVCDELQLDTLSEVAMMISCDHLCSLGEELSHSNCVEFLTAAVLPKVKVTITTVPRSLCSVLAKVSKQFPRALIDGVITPCLQDVDAAVCQAQMFCKVIKEMFSGASRLYLLQKLVDGSVPVSAGLLSLIQILIDLKVDMDRHVMHSLVHLLAKFSGPFAEDIKFGKLLLAFVTKYGKQMNMECVDLLKVVSSENQTFLKKAVSTAIAKIEKEKSLTRS
ncbi:uncharacterized protein LOC135468385 [Liolophura sinensis]|uniref:uncharacterized protein LOC135468385 n=1 Tax=Liolophura sinensis TaxID=3198878 RepID=UPI00315858AB